MLRQRKRKKLLKCSWLEEKRKTGKLKTIGQTVCVSPEVYAHWTLSKTESEGIEDERNKKKMIGICNELKIYMDQTHNQILLPNNALNWKINQVDPNIWK